MESTRWPKVNSLFAISKELQIYFDGGFALIGFRELLIQLSGKLRHLFFKEDA